MTDFHDNDHSIDEVTLQGVSELPLESSCSEALKSALQQWQKRENPIDSATELLQIDKVRLFTISYRGESGNYWPSEGANFIEEGLIRDYLFNDGICGLEGMEPRLYLVKYGLMALLEKEYILICPYPTEAGNIAGMVVLCANHHIERADT